MWSFVHVTVWSCGQVTNEKHCMYTAAIPTITKLDREVTYGGGPHPLSHLTFYMTNEKPYSCISAKPIASKFERAISYGWKTQPAKSYDLLITWSCEKFKNLYLYFNNTNGNQTWQGSDLEWGTPLFMSFKNILLFSWWYCVYWVLCYIKIIW